MPLPPEVSALVERFSRNLDVYKSSDYNEARLRVEFLDPLFQSLGWDIANTAGYADAYKDVVHEDSLKITGTLAGVGGTKAPDYSFRIGGTRKFFLEAKKPAIDIKSDPSPAYQLRRYAWSAKLPISVLSDFEEFAIYDTRIKPNVNDKASTARIFYCTYDELAEKWDEIAAILAKDSVLKGSFDKYAEGAKGKRGTAEVDDAFLAEIEKWRDELATNIALRNPQISERDLNVAVTKTIDRIVFLRICEDRGVEIYAQLQLIAKTNDIYGELLKLFRRADEKYNSGLFHFSKEKDRPEEPDTLTPALDIDDKTLRPILASLYYPDCPYEFSVLPSDILGHVYEQFLGKVIRLTPGHRAKVEEKPEVRKAGGVYYTPTYIVTYIVQNTVGKLLGAPDGNPGPDAPQNRTRSVSEGQTPQDAAKLKILDPACGSGSFLLGAYQYLLDWHLRYYTTHNPEQLLKTKNPPIYQTTRNAGILSASPAYRLTTNEKKRILLNNIYGVDIDQNAVETTKLSLLLKVLENESTETLANQFKLFRERALPDLANNIKCGNSLIAPDFYENEQLILIDDEETQFRINAFNWAEEFKEIIRGGGFTIIIGNPPYIFTRNEGIGEPEKAYYYGRFQYQGPQLNTFGLFLEKCYGFLATSGIFGFITPNNWLTIDSFSNLREMLLKSTGSTCVVNIKDRVFQDANVDTCIIAARKSKPNTVTLAEMKEQKISFSKNVSPKFFKGPSYIIQLSMVKDQSSHGLLEKIAQCSEPLSVFATVSTGLKCYQTGKGKPSQTDKIKEGRIFHSEQRKNKTFERYLEGSDVCRYSLGWSGEYLSYGNWLAEPRRSVPFSGPRLLIRQIPNHPPYMVHAVYTEAPYYNDINSMVIFQALAPTSLLYLLGIINSRLISFWFEKVYDKMQRNIFPQFKVKELAQFPIRRIDFQSPVQKSKHDRLVKLVDTMLVLHQQLAKAKSGREQIQRQITASDHQIDALVYDLYQLTPEEIQLVEQATPA